jgi:hypothetical protein
LALRLFISTKREGFNVNKIYITKGYNSYTNKELIKAFSTEKEADSFMEGLTDPHLIVVKYKSTLDAVNFLLKGF